VALTQRCPWVGSTRGLGWVGLRFCSFRLVGLGRIWQKYYIFNDYTTYNCKGPWCIVNTKGYEKLSFFDQYLALFRKWYKIRHSYNGKSLTADSFAVSCIELGWVHIFSFAMGWVGSFSWWKWTHGQLCTNPYTWPYQPTRRGPDPNQPADFQLGIFFRGNNLGGCLQEVIADYRQWCSVLEFRARSD